MKAKWLSDLELLPLHADLDILGIWYCHRPRK